MSRIAALLRSTTRSRAALSAAPDLEAIASEIVARAQAAWPAFALDEDGFLAHVGVQVEDATDPRAELAALAIEDLALAYAAGRGHPRAIAEVDRRIAPAVAEAVARLKRRAEAGSADDLAQLVRHRLFVSAPGETPKILRYSGRGPLTSWLRIVALRRALEASRHGDAAHADPVTREALLGIPTAHDPELEHFRARYTKDFKVAFEAALAELSAEERNLLRMSLVDALSIDQIGAIFGVHRATAARRVARARERIQERTRELLVARLRVTTEELDSILRCVESVIDVSLQRLLATEGDATPEG